MVDAKLLQSREPELKTLVQTNDLSSLNFLSQNDSKIALNPTKNDVTVFRSFGRSLEDIDLDLLRIGRSKRVDLS